MYEGLYFFRCLEEFENARECIGKPKANGSPLMKVPGSTPLPLPPSLPMVQGGSVGPSPPRPLVEVPSAEDRGGGRRRQSQSSPASDMK